MLMFLSFCILKSTGSAKLSLGFVERFSNEGQADFAINKAFYMSLKDKNNMYISCIFNGFKYIFHVSSYFARCRCDIDLRGVLVG